VRATKVLSEVASYSGLCQKRSLRKRKLQNLRQARALYPEF
jgi:hypothetical protein